ncbi:MAG TPA: GTPase HflX [Allosphingosinicella sp.]|jgi:GTP-binding protein HflX
MTTGFERDQQDFARGARAIVVLPDTGRAARDADARLAETAGLALAIGVEVVHRQAVRLRQPKPATLIGSGQVEAIAQTVRDDDLQLAVFDAALSPVQQRNLETALKCKVIDRTGLILEIFGERAATAEGRLQVELAHLDYQAGRLVRSWTHLERQRGGFGFLGGPGETQIEADRRLIRDRMARLKRELDQVSRTRGLHRDRRQRAPWPVIALVGYTNAGKSTLFNLLTGADVMAENLLFATLDPTLRQISLPGLDKAILSDTVGFVSQLPTQLVAAFKATLEEVVSADLLLHVRDIAHPDTEAQRADVEKVLSEIGVSLDSPRLEIWNKLDLLDDDRRAEVAADAARRDDVVAISSLTGEGTDLLLETVAACLTQGHRRYHVVLDAGDGAGAAWLHAHGDVVGSVEEDGQVDYDVRMAPSDHERFLQR